MTKTILLVGGPDDGCVRELDHSLTKYKVVHPRPLKLGSVILSMRTGIYRQTGEYSGTREIYLWKGWEK
jgi:hypothetical protein